MDKKDVRAYLITLIVCFFIGIAVALSLYALDRREIVPLSGGQTLQYADFGFTLHVPEGAVVRDHTQENYEAGGDALYAGSITTQEDGVLYLYCYENAAHDSLEGYREQEVVTHYMSRGATQVRMRELGGRRFVCYRASVLGPAGEELWDTYETWDERLQITFETRMAPRKVLPILAALEFNGN